MKNIRQLLLICVCWLAAATAVNAQGVDVTSYFLTNPDFESGTASGWTIDVNSYQNGGYQKATYINGTSSVSKFIEVWRESSYGPLGDGKIFQTTTLPAGSYTLQADAIASRQNSFIQPEGVSLMACDHANGELLGATSMATESGKPQRFTADFTLDKEKEVELGILIKNTTTNWVAADNFKLYMAAGMTTVTSISLSAPKTTLIPGETVQLSPKILPENATFKQLTWTSTKESVLKVDQNGIVKAVGIGSATIRATAQDGTRKSGTIYMTVKQSGATADALVINEVMAMNIDQFVDPSWNYGGWVEFYNPTDEPVTLFNHYMTDDRNNLKKHQLRNADIVPAHGYCTVWFDHFSEKVFPTQVDFKLNTEGGWIGLVSPEGNLLVEETYPAGVARTSWARATDGGSTWGITPQPTPGSTNVGSTFATNRLAAPTVDVEGHLFTKYPVTIRASWPAGSTLRYTWDGSAPTATNGMTSTTGVFKVTTGVQNTLRLCAVKDGMLPSEVVTNTYLYKQHDFTIPVMVISGTDNDFFSDQMGCLVEGTNGVAGGNNWVWNVYQDWDRPAVFEYFAPTGERIFCQDVDISAAGGWSRTYSWHTSFNIKASKVYEGKNSLDYPFFARKPYLKHKTLRVRNGGNDSGCRFRDAGSQMIIGTSGLYVDYQEYLPVFHYINGRYGCVYNLREPNNKQHAYSNYGLDTDMMDQFELTAHPVGGNYYEQMVGTKDTLNLLLDLSAQCADPVIYKRICDELLDIDEYINYMAVEIWMGCGDWITNTNNVKGFRSTEGDGRFHFVILDMDDPFGNQNMARSIDNTSNEMATLWHNMLNNADFRKKFVDTYSLVCGSVFEAERCKKVLDEMYAAVEPMMNLSGESASSSYNTLRNRFGTGSWNNSVLYNNTQGFSRLSNETRQPVNMTFSANNAHAQFLYNGMDVPTGKFTGRVFLPVTLTAGDVAGYDFAGWKVAGGQVKNKTTMFGYGDAWLYYDQGSLDGVNWTALNYGANGWSKGYGPLGYDTKFGDLSKELKTTLGYGGNANSKYPTYYFRHDFTLDSTPGSTDTYTLEYRVDDGCIIYVNGTEVKRDNMPSGNITFNSYSTTYDQKTATVDIPMSLLKKGSNVIAAEVHNNNATSTDILWDAALYKVAFEDNGNDFVSTNPELQLTSDYEGQELIAVYTDSSADDVPVKINEVSAGNVIYVNDYAKKDDWIELYNATDEAIDVAGMYLSDDENTPQQFQIPTNDELQTVIEPHGHLVVWTSKRNIVGSQIHTNFKLSNADGETVVLTSEDGSWSNKLVYNAHSGRETVGLYPDGGNGVYKLSRPTVGKQNARTAYDLFLYVNETQTGDKETFTLNLNEGWNWISHPLEKGIAVADVNANALRFVSQTADATKVEGIGWTGSLTELTARNGYKVQMASDETFTFNGPFVNSSRGAMLHTGWNWIGYPSLGSQNVAAAFADFTAADGDVIVGRQGFSTFENGSWSGSLDVLKGGAGYLYKSAEPKTLTFAETEGGGAQKVAPRFRMQPRTPWTVYDALYPDVMSMVVRIESDEDCAFSLGAFGNDGECRGIGKLVDGQLFLTAFGCAGEEISFKAADAATGLVYDVVERFTFAPDVLGSRRAPVVLHADGVTDVVSAKQGKAVMAVAYYDLNGTFAGKSKDALEKGLYIKKCIMNDGTTISKKIVIL